jgi:membrane protease YdiL (CAAX protease family)
MRALIAARRDTFTNGFIVLFGLAGLAAAVSLRVRVAGVAGSQSLRGGLVFGITLCLLAVCLGFDWPSLGRSALGWGVAGAAVLCVPPTLHKLLATSGLPAAPTVGWVSVVSLVAVVEELLLRGALYERLRRWRGQTPAIAITAIAFALLHVPLYGWHVVVLDLAVGVWLGTLRAVSGSVTAPALAHTLADLAGWWLQ